MKKIVSLLVFTAALIWTWNLVNSSSAIGFETHSGIQQKLSVLIQETIQKKKPEARDFQIMRLWTEPMNDNKIRAVFAYKFVEGKEDSAEQTLEGEAILHREVSADSGTDRWTLQSVKTTSDSVIFNEGSVVNPSTPDESGATPTPPVASPEEHKADTHKEE